MKRSLIIILAALIVAGTLAITACAPTANAGQQEEPPAQEQTAPPQTAQPEEPQEEPAQEEGQQQDETEAPQEQIPFTYMTMGEITEILDDGTQLHVVGQNDGNPANDVLANISEDTIVVDAQTGRPADVSALQEGDTVAVYVSSKMTFSLPPMTNAYAVITGLPESGMGVPTYLIADTVTQNEDGSVSVLSKNGDLVVTIPADVEIGVFGQDDQTAAHADITEDSVLLAWFDVVAESYPAQASATQAMLVQSE